MRVTCIKTNVQVLINLINISPKMRRLLLYLLMCAVYGDCHDSEFSKSEVIMQYLLYMSIVRIVPKGGKFTLAYWIRTERRFSRVFLLRVNRKPISILYYTLNIERFSQ